MSGTRQNFADGRSIELATTGERTGPSAERVCGFCRNGPVDDAATWLDGVPREPAPCPRCGETYAGPLAGVEYDGQQPEEAGE